jgi:hypothetical protein
MQTKHVKIGLCESALTQFSNSSGVLLVHYNCENVCFSRMLSAQVLRNQSRFPFGLRTSVRKNRRHLSSLKMLSGANTFEISKIQEAKMNAH